MINAAPKSFTNALPEHKGNRAEHHLKCIDLEIDQELRLNSVVKSSEKAGPVDVSRYPAGPGTAVYPAPNAAEAELQARKPGRLGKEIMMGKK
ncbi:hypothetical protein QFC24_003001 [Naganishia onofrii]|uniref:Uncharacterized protein n=1 Tax=Naganishia onofrii TaxID=1851511 RepID=A0ACC2XMP5_9TREE|nr:hypothetical protein QFC24_003001 [Naganishia onofrii]